METNYKDLDYARKAEKEALETINEKIRNLKAAIADECDALELKLETHYDSLFEMDGSLQETISNLESYKNSEYQFDKHGDLMLRTSFPLYDYDDNEQEQLERYLEDNHGITLDADYEALTMYLGDDYISIQTDTRDSNGVWQYGKMIIPEREYLTNLSLDGYGDRTGESEVDETKRNRLIEEHMEREGYFPIVGEVTRDGDFYPVNTSKKEGE